MKIRSKRYFIDKKVSKVINRAYLLLNILINEHRRLAEIQKPKPQYKEGGFGLKPMIVGESNHGEVLYGYPIMKDGCILGLKEPITELPKGTNIKPVNQSFEPLADMFKETYKPHSFTFSAKTPEGIDISKLESFFKNEFDGFKGFKIKIGK